MDMDWTWLRNPSPRLAGFLRVLRFLVVGGINTVFGYSVYALLIWAGLPIEIAVLLSTVLGVMFNFVTYGRLAFGGRLSGMALIRFVGVYTLLYFLNVALLKILVTTGYSAYIAPFIVLPVMVGCTFALLRYFVFPRQRAPQF